MVRGYIEVQMPLAYRFTVLLILFRIIYLVQKYAVDRKIEQYVLGYCAIRILDIKRSESFI